MISCESFCQRVTTLPQVVGGCSPTVVLYVGLLVQKVLRRFNKVLGCCHWWRVFSGIGIVCNLTQAQRGGYAGCMCGRSCDSLRISDK